MHRNAIIIMNVGYSMHMGLKHCILLHNNIIIIYIYIYTGPTECQDGVTNDCTETCTRTVSNGTSSYECGCYEGYELNPDNTTCHGKHVCDIWVCL